MASLGKRSSFASGLGGDEPPDQYDGFLRRIASSPSGIRCANLPPRYRGETELAAPISIRYSGVAVASMEPSDKSDLSGVIRNKNWKSRTLIFT